jgi:hypothetical protein
LDAGVFVFQPHPLCGCRLVAILMLLHRQLALSDALLLFPPVA